MPGNDGLTVSYISFVFETYRYLSLHLIRKIAYSPCFTQDTFSCLGFSELPNPSLTIL